MIKMEKRKILALGQSSRVISLPKIWLKSNNIKKGDWISVLPQSNGSLLIYPSNEETQDIPKIQLKIVVNEGNASIGRKIIGAYMDGYTHIKLRSEKIFTVDQQAAIRQVANTLYMRIIESEASIIVLETLINESKASVFVGVERIHLITYSMFRDTLQALRTKDRALAASIASLENDVDQLMFFLLRLIRSAAQDLSLGSKLGIDPLDCLEYQNLVQSIENIADHVAIMATSVVALLDSDFEVPASVYDGILEVAEEVFSSYDLAVRCFLSSNVEPTNEIIDGESLIEGLSRQLTPLPLIGGEGGTSLLAHIISIRESIKRISQYISDIAELTIDRAYKIKK
jgi:phosphate uptake regulator